MTRLIQNKAFGAATKDKPETVKAALDVITEFIKEDPRNPDLHFSYAALACEGATADPGQILSHVTTAASSIRDGVTSGMAKASDLYGLKAKLEFEVGRFDDAMRDLDTAIAADIEGAPNVFNDGGTTVRTQVKTCVWSPPELEALAKRFPNDYRPHLYLGLYRSGFLRFNHDADPNPVIDAYNASSKLNPASALPHYFLGELYAVNIGGVFSSAGASCIEDFVPRTKECLELDEIRRLGVRHLTAAIALDTGFVDAYSSRAEQLLRLKEYRQAIRDYNKVIDLKPSKELMHLMYNDRGVAKIQLGQYQDAILDLTRSIELGCSDFCGSYEARADAYDKLADYPHALADIGVSIKRVIGNSVYLMHIENFRRLYPEYDGVADDVLAEKLRTLFFPKMGSAAFSKQFLIDGKFDPTFVLVDFYIKRGDIYSKMGQARQAELEYDRVSKVFPKFAANLFEMKNGRRVRVAQ